MSDSANSEKPLIGITSGSTSRRFPILCHKFAVWRAGGRPIVIKPDSNMDYIRELSGIIISGGSDINPKLYDQKNTASVNIDDARDRLEAECISHAFNEKLPILGVCRGSQMINVICGGDLIQDIPTVLDGFVPTQSFWSKTFVRRKIMIESGSRLSRVLGNNKEAWVNSLHHQAHNKLGQGLRIVARDEQNVVQSIEGVNQDHFVLGVQWHPELMLYSSEQRKIYKALVAASRRTHSNWYKQSVRRARQKEKYA